MRKQVISFTLEPELEEYLRKMADMAHISISQYLRNLLWSGYEIDKQIAEEAKPKKAIVDANSFRF